MRTSFHHQSEAQPPNGPLTAATSPDTPSYVASQAVGLDRSGLDVGARRMPQSPPLNSANEAQVVGQMARVFLGADSQKGPAISARNRRQSLAECPQSEATWSRDGRDQGQNLVVLGCQQPIIGGRS
jgi:hypothetical protein